MQAWKILALISLATLVSASAFAADMSRIRLMAPVSEGLVYEAEEVTFADIDVDQPSTTGGSLSYVHSSGFGIGYTAISTTFSYDVNVNISFGPFTQTGTTATVTLAPGDTLVADTWTVAPSFLDVSYTFGEAFSATVGLGVVVGGDFTMTREFGSKLTDFYSGLEEIKLEVDSISGSAFFVNVGYALGSLELLVGYRSNSVTATASGTGNEGFSGTIALFSQDIEAEFTDTTTEVMAGIGIVF